MSWWDVICSWATPFSKSMSIMIWKRLSTVKGIRKVRSSLIIKRQSLMMPSCVTSRNLDFSSKTTKERLFILRCLKLRDLSTFPNFKESSCSISFNTTSHFTAVSLQQIKAWSRKCKSRPVLKTCALQYLLLKSCKLSRFTWTYQNSAWTFLSASTRFHWQKKL